MSEQLADDEFPNDPLDGMDDLAPPPPEAPAADEKPAKARRVTRARAPRKRATPKAPASGAKRRTGPDYRGTVKGLLDGPVMALSLAGMANPVLAADAMAIDAHSQNIAEAVHLLAVERPEVAALLDRLTTVGPYSAIFSALLPLALQLAVNHGVLPAGLMGTVDLVPPRTVSVPVSEPIPFPEGFEATAPAPAFM